MHLRVERLIRVTGDRIYYLVNNSAPRWHTRKCWTCGHKHSPPNAQACTYCSAPLGFQRFIMSARWDLGSAMTYQAYAHRRLKFRSLGRPLALYRYENLLLACYEWRGEQLLSGEPAPIDSQRILSIAFQLADALDYLHTYGVVLKKITAHNVLLSREGQAKLFDLEIEKLVDRPIPPSDRSNTPPRRDLTDISRLLKQWVPLEDSELRQFLFQACRESTTADAYAGAVSAFAYGRTPSSSLWEAAGTSDVGVKRTLNEDAWAWERVSSDCMVVAIADGMSGVRSGLVAAQTATNSLIHGVFEHLPTEPDGDELESAMRTAVESTAARVFEKNKECSSHPGGTTLTAIVMRNSSAVVAHAGDSRAYLFRNGQLRQITEDHSHAAALVASGKLTAEEARSHAKSNILLNFLGEKLEPDVDFYQLDIEAKDRILLCTDGLWGELSDTLIAEQLAKGLAPRPTVRALLRLANDQGGSDNVTAVVVDVPMEP